VNPRIVTAALSLALSLSTAVSSPAFAEHRGIFSPRTTTADDPTDPSPLPPPPGPGFALHF